ncbi:unnamed protein product [Urochloa humidicola]
MATEGAKQFTLQVEMQCRCIGCVKKVEKAMASIGTLGVSVESKELCRRSFARLAAVTAAWCPGSAESARLGARVRQRPAVRGEGEQRAQLAEGAAVVAVGASGDGADP